MKLEDVDSLLQELWDNPSRDKAMKLRNRAFDRNDEWYEAFQNRNLSNEYEETLSSRLVLDICSLRLYAEGLDAELAPRTSKAATEEAREFAKDSDVFHRDSAPEKKFIQ